MTDMDTTDLIYLGLARRMAASGAARALRVAAAIPQSEVARLCGTWKSSIAHAEAGRKRPAHEWGVRYGRFLEELMLRGER